MGYLKRLVEQKANLLTGDRTAEIKLNSLDYEQLENFISLFRSAYSGKGLFMQFQRDCKFSFENVREKQYRIIFDKNSFVDAKYIDRKNYNSYYSFWEKDYLARDVTVETLYDDFDDNQSVVEEIESLDFESNSPVRTPRKAWSSYRKSTKERYLSSVKSNLKSFIKESFGITNINEIDQIIEELHCGAKDLMPSIALNNTNLMKCSHGKKKYKKR